jgi:hypothetical protein
MIFWHFSMQKKLKSSEHTLCQSLEQLNVK